MHSASEIIESGRLQMSSDSWLLITTGKLILVDIPFLPDMSLDEKPVTILGKMGVPQGSPFLKLIAEKIIDHEAIAKKAYGYYLDNPARLAEENWFRAQEELLHM